MILKQWINMVLIKFIKICFDKSRLWLNTDRGDKAAFVGIMISLLDSVFLKLELDELPWYHNGWSAGSTQTNSPGWETKSDFLTGQTSVIIGRHWIDQLLILLADLELCHGTRPLPGSIGTSLVYPLEMSVYKISDPNPPSGKLEGGKKLTWDKVNAENSSTIVTLPKNMSQVYVTTKTATWICWGANEEDKLSSVAIGVKAKTMDLGVQCTLIQHSVARCSTV